MAITLHDNTAFVDADGSYGYGELITFDDGDIYSSVCIECKEEAFIYRNDAGSYEVQSCVCPEPERESGN